MPLSWDRPSFVSDLLVTNDSSIITEFDKKLNEAAGYPQLWQIVKETAEYALSKGSRSMMLFLDDLPVQLGAYHPVGTNNIILNRRLVDIVEVTVGSKTLVNSIIYILLLHEYLHALGDYSETSVRKGVVQVSEKCFGTNHAVSDIARKSPWSLLGKIPVQAIGAPRRVIQIVKNFESTQKYIV
jgi:hypothetical protein